jgi:hypothetical protein
MQRDDCRYRLSEKTAAKQCWGDPNNPTGRAKMRGNSILLFICSITSVRLTIEQFQLDMITSHSGSVELWCQGL